MRCSLIDLAYTVYEVFTYRFGSTIYEVFAYRFAIYSDKLNNYSVAFKTRNRLQ